MALSFFKKLISNLAGKNENRSNKLLDFIKLTGLEVTNVLAKGILQLDTKSAKELIKHEEDRDFDDLKKELKKIVYGEIGDDGRLVVFIDDLDRLEPVKAVELMEVIKNFLDIERCVFVYAIDFSIVKFGVKKNIPA